MGSSESESGERQGPEKHDHLLEFSEPGDFALTRTIDGDEKQFDPAAVAHVLGRSEVIRQRALNAATISAGAAAALAAVAGLSGITRRSAWVQILVVVALCAWLLSVWLNIRAVALPPKESVEGENERRDDYDDVERMLEAHRSYAASLRGRVRLAAYAAAGALALTASAIVAGFVDRRLTGFQTLVLSLEPKTVAALRADCGWSASPPRVIAKVRTDDLSGSMVPIELGRADCVTKQAAIHVPRRAIRAARRASKREAANGNTVAIGGG